MAITDIAVTDVPMRQYSDAEIAAYIASGDPFDKAGGYAIQHAGFRPAVLTSGCFANVVGLPLCYLAARRAPVRALRGRDVPEFSLPGALRLCVCDVSAAILDTSSPKSPSSRES